MVLRENTIDGNIDPSALLVFLDDGRRACRVKGIRSKAHEEWCYWRNKSPIPTSSVTAPMIGGSGMRYFFFGCDFYRPNDHGFFARGIIDALIDKS